MSSHAPRPSDNEDKVDSNSSRDNTLLSSNTTHPSSTSNPRKNNEVDMLVCQPRLPLSRQGVLQPLQSQGEIESPSTRKRPLMEEKADALQTLPPLCANLRAIPSNHDSLKPRMKYADALTKPVVLSREPLDDTSDNVESPAEQKEIPNRSSPDGTNGRTTEGRNATENDGSDGDLPCRHPPMKRARTAPELFIRIPTTPPLAQSQIATPEQKTLTDSKHITHNNTAILTSPKTGNNKMAVLQESAVNSIANSSTTESSSSSLTPVQESATTTPSKSTTTGIEKGAGSENMNATGKVVKDSLPPSKIDKPLTKLEIDKTTTVVVAKTIATSPAKSLSPEKEQLPTKKSILESAKSEVSKVSETKSEPVVKEFVENQTKKETVAMSVIKNSPVQQAVSSFSPPTLPANQIKASGNSGGKVTKNSSSSSGTPAVSTTTKKKRNSSGNKRKRSSSSSQKAKGQSSGRWTQEEHQAFLEGLTECGREWKKVALRIPTRTSAQIRSHAQKYFAKLQRDQESSATSNVAMVHGDLNSPLMTGDRTGAGLVVLGEGGRLSGTIVTAPGVAALAPSVRKNVERIVADPRGAQKEVEEKMEALRERYRQLQKRLEERRQKREESKKTHQKQASQPLSTSSMNTSISSEVSAFASPPSIPNNQSNNRLSRNRISLPIMKKTDGPTGRVSSPPSSDENSSVCSNVSSIAASRTDLNNQEIMALQVLGGDLPRSESSNDLHVLGGGVFQPQGDSSVEVDGTMPSIHDNISSTSYDLLAPLPGVGNDIDSMMNQGAAVPANEKPTHDSGNTGSVSVGGISATGDSSTIATNATAT